MGKQKEIKLKYGCNPSQEPARIFMKKGKLPVEVLNGQPGYINFLDALNGFSLVRELHEATGLPAATSFKHVSPAGAAVGLPLGETEERMYFARGLALSPLATAYVRARGADRVSSYGDWIALSDICDEETAAVIAIEVSDGIIAPGFTSAALDILKQKRKGGFCIVKIDQSYMPPEVELKDVYGITFEQRRNDVKIDESYLANIVTDNKNMPESARRDLLIALITLKYTQSNSVCLAVSGQTIGVGAGQQSRIHCTRLASDKADNWILRQHPKVLELSFGSEISRFERDNAIDEYISGDALAPSAKLSIDEKIEWISHVSGVSLGSDGFFPFGDNIERAKRSGVRYIAQPGGSIRDDNVIDMCNKYDMVMVLTGMRLFHH